MRESRSPDTHDTASDTVTTGELTICKRVLPHWQMGGATYFLTFRLHGHPGYITHLNENERRLVTKTILSLHHRTWDVFLLTVMPDHVHILVTPLEQTPGKWYSLATILQQVKGNTAFTINRMRGRNGTLWQKETFDRIIRDNREFIEKATYIFNNAIKAGLVENGWEYDGFWCADDAAAG